MGKLFRVKSPSGKHKNWRDKKLKNPFGSVYRQKTIKPRHGDTPPEEDEDAQVSYSYYCRF